MDEPNPQDEDDYLCVGICLPDENEAYCIGCGRPWSTRGGDDLRVPVLVEDEDTPPTA